MLIRTVAILIFCLHIAQPAAAQGTEVPFGSLQHDASLPIEITADRLDVDQTNNNAIFQGNVVVGQGEMRLSTARLEVEYGAQETPDAGKIVRLFASGGVTFVNGPEAAESETANYSITDQLVTMQGSVVLTQGQNALSSETMVIDLERGTAQLDGRVRTILNTENP